MVLQCTAGRYTRFPTEPERDKLGDVGIVPDKGK